MICIKVQYASKITISILTFFSRKPFRTWFSLSKCNKVLAFEVLFQYILCNLDFEQNWQSITHAEFWDHTGEFQLMIHNTEGYSLEAASRTYLYTFQHILKHSPVKSSRNDHICSPDILASICFACIFCITLQIFCSYFWYTPNNCLNCVFHMRHGSSYTNF